MRRFLTLALLLTFGCSTTVHVQRPISNGDAQRIASLLHGQDATVTYAPDGAAPEKDVASDVAVTADQVQWVRWESEQARSRGSPPGQRVAAPVDAVKKVSICGSGCHSKGVLQGMGAGALVGVLVSAIVVSTCKPSKELGNLCGFGWIPGPVLGILVGGLIGARGTTTNIDFEPAPVAK